MAKKANQKEEQKVSVRIVFSRKFHFNSVVEMTVGDYEKIKNLNDEVYEHSQEYYVFDDNMEMAGRNAEPSNLLEDVEVTLCQKADA
jgi:hypothetical protein